MPKAAKARWKAHGVFWRSWLRAPLRVGAITPSSPHLARVIASQVKAHQPGWVIELGAGNGVVTRALLNAGVHPERLLLVERDRRLCKFLRQHFPEAHVVHGDARELSAILAEHRVHKISALVSCLPLLIFPKPAYECVVTQMLETLPPQARLVQFTYGLHSPIARRLLVRHRAAVSARHHVWLNVPPARVWVYERKE